MNGIEKLTQQISADAQVEIDKILADAQASADAVTADYARRAEKAAADIRSKGETAAAQREERLLSMAAMEGRKELLAAKQDMVSKAFDLALDKLCALPDEEYVALLARLAVAASTTGREQLIFSQKDRTRVGKAVVTAANEILAKAVAPKLPGEVTDTKAGALLDKVVTGASALLAGTGMLTLSEQTRPMRGGFILSDGDVEVNCAFETLVRLQRNEISGEVADVLFA
ncbi:MAG: V-type ATP synthase subunit E [Oscillospiraceae bacterium]